MSRVRFFTSRYLICGERSNYFSKSCFFLASSFIGITLKKSKVHSIIATAISNRTPHPTKSTTILQFVKTMKEMKELKHIRMKIVVGSVVNANVGKM